MKRTKPTEKLSLPAIPQDAPVSAHTEQYNEVIAFGQALADRGVPPVFEVWFPGTTDADFDVLVYDPATGTLETAPPYTDTEFWAKAA